MAAVLALLVGTAVAGLLLIVLALQRRAVGEGPGWRFWPGRLTLTSSLLRTALLGVGCGALLWLASGWPVYLFAVPVIAITLPALLGTDQTQTQLRRLDALESWTRNLAGLTVAGASLEQTIAASLPSTDQAIREQVAALVARINARWHTASALRAFAAEIADPSCDLLVMHLLLAERMRGPGLSGALDDLATAIAHEVRARRAIATDRAKPRQNSRIITVTTLVLLAALPLAGSFMEPYRSATGQLLLTGWLALYVLILVWMRRTCAERPAPRLLDEAGRG